MVDQRLKMVFCSVRKVRKGFSDSETTKVKKSTIASTIDPAPSNSKYSSNNIFLVLKEEMLATNLSFYPKLNNPNEAWIKYTQQIGTTLRIYKIF